MTPDEKDLLASVLADESDGAFREAQRQRWLRAGARRRGWRRLRVAGAFGVIVVGVAGWLGWHTGAGDRLRAAIAAAVKSQQVTSAARIAEVRTSASTIRIVSTEPQSVEFVETRSAQATVREISDEELFALFPGRAVAIVGSGTGHAQLILPEQLQADARAAEF